MDIRELENQLAAADSLEQIMDLMKRALAAIGVDQFTYIFQIVETFHTPPCICMTSYPPDFLSFYMENACFRVDPLMKHYALSSLPLFYRLDDDWSAYGPDAVEFQQELKDRGYWGGVCLPFFTKEGSRGFLAFPTQSHDATVVSQAATICLMIRYFHHHTLRIWLKIHPGHTSLRARLTPREKEIYRFIADGLTSQEIGEQLNVARTTVEKFITSVQEKLQAGNRQQALCKAVNLGLLQPDLNYTNEDVLWVF